MSVRVAHLGGAGGMATVGDFGGAVGDFGFPPPDLEPADPFANTLSRYRINRRENRMSVRVVYEYKMTVVENKYSPRRSGRNGRGRRLRIPSTGLGAGQSFCKHTE